MVARTFREPAPQAAAGAGPWLALRRLGATATCALEAMVRARFGMFATPQQFRPRRRAQLMSEAAARLIEAHGIDIVVTGALETEPAILVANHLGYLDPVVVASLVPCAPIAKSELAGWPLLGASARDVGAIFLRRGDAWSGARVLREARRRLDDGVSILNFPEGTTSLGSSVARFRRGIFGLARMAGVPVVPVALRFPVELCWAGDAFFLPHYLRVAARPAARISVHFGRPLASRDFEDAETMAEVARRRVHQLLRRCT